MSGPERPQALPLSARITTLDELIARRTAWSALMAEAIEPNPFYGPDYLTASERCLHPERPIRCLVVEQGARLVGLLPLRTPHLLDGLMGRAWQMYKNPFTCLGTPVLAGDLAIEAVRAAMACLAATPGPKRLHIATLPLDGAVARLLAGEAAAEHLPLRLANVTRRATITGVTSRESYAEQHWSRERRKQLRQKQRRLERMGLVAVSSIGRDDPGFPEARAEFLALEAASWKGQYGTALSQTPATRAFAERAFDGPDSRIQRLTLDGRPIAMILMLTGQATGYSVKVAYDEAFAALSPGHLLDAATIDLLGTPTGLEKLDSCALAGHPVEALWCQREPIGDLVLGLSRSVPELSVSVLGFALDTARRLRGLRHRRSYTTRPVGANPTASRGSS